MSKKGGGKRKTVAKAEPKMPEVDRTFYELTIGDFTKKLARCRTNLVTLEDTNVSLKQQLKEITEDRMDVAGLLEKTLAERNDYIQELEDNLLETAKVRKRENMEAAEKMKDMDLKYKSMHDQLTSEIKLLNGKLSSLDEFRIQRDILMAKFDEQEVITKEKENVNRELVYHMEQQAVVDRDNLKKEVEARLLQVSEDFTRSSEIRNAYYTRRLIRENIALQKEIESLVLSQIKMQKDFEEHVRKNKEMAEEYNALDQLKTELIRSSQNKIKIIEKLTENYERLKAKYLEVLKYRRLYEHLAKHEVCERVTVVDMSKKLKMLGQRVDGLKLEKNRFISQQEQTNMDIAKLREVIRKIRTTVEIAIKAVKEEKEVDTMPGSQHTAAGDEPAMEEAATFRQLKRKDLLDELLEIVGGQVEDAAATNLLVTPAQSKSSLYRPGKIGFLPMARDSLMDVFKYDAKCILTTDLALTGYELKREESLIIPKERASEAGIIYDIQIGSSYYVSDSHEALDGPVEPTEELQDMGEEMTSSEFDELPQAIRQSINIQRKSTSPEKKPSIVEETKAEVEKAASEHKVVEKTESVHSGEEKEPVTAVSHTTSRESRMSRLPSMPDTEGEEYDINLFY